jgi:hypothetical protein
MSSKPKSVSVAPPPDPDPVPMASGLSNGVTDTEKRQIRKKSNSYYGRTKTILAGDTPQDNDTKKTILGG